MAKNLDKKFVTLHTYPNVIITPHIAFMTDEGLQQIA